MKRIIAMLLGFMILVMQFQVLPVNAAGTTVIVHYQRTDGDYEPWALWVWPEGGDGEVVEFDYEDAYGQVAVIQLNSPTDRVGFIVRTEDWQKDIGSDRFIELTAGQAEVWLLTGEEAFVYEAPDGYEVFDLSLAEIEETAPIVLDGDGVPLRIHYHRFDGNYEGWNLWVWALGGQGAAKEFTGTDDYGYVSEMLVQDVDADGMIGFIARLNDWEAKDVAIDRFVPVSKIGTDGVLDVWLLQGDENIYYNPDDIDLSPKILAAAMYGMDRINITVSVPFELEASNKNFTVIDNEGKRIASKHVMSSLGGSMAGSATVILEQPMEVGKTYTVLMEGYGEMAVAMDRVFGTDEFVEAFTYPGDDLGAVYTPEGTAFRVWAPTASDVKLNLYKTGHEDDLIQSVTMMRDIKGTYTSTVEGDQAGVYYTYEVTANGKTNEAVDPYARTTGVNGDRAMVIDLDSTDPEGWIEDHQVSLAQFTDAVLYELHIRDLSISEDSGIENKGKFLGLTERGTVSPEGEATGLDHLIDLGVTHIHLLPSFDHRSIDETNLEANNFNWGYDPENYNVPEGSYASDPYNGKVRVQEFKTMVKTLHDNDLGVVLDVVYNHTGASVDSHLNKIVPGYYYRTVDGKFSNGSGCGNETASERSMVRKMIVDSVVYWANEYHIDGFRFDLMGLHDIETMNAVRAALDEVDPSIIIYGEGWTGGASPLPDNKKALKASTFHMPGIAAFSDDLRDGIKGHVFTSEAPGFVNGHESMEETIKFGVVASTIHDQIDYKSVNYSDFPWADSPEQTINYVSAHDNLTLFDKLTVTDPEATLEEKAAMVKMSNAIVFTSQGIPFMHAGVEMLRTKDGDHNSYTSSDEVNKLEWHWKNDYPEVVEYHKGLIDFRAEHPALRMTDTAEVQSKLSFFGDGEAYGHLQMAEEEVVAYLINEHANGDTAGAILVIYNANEDDVTLDIPESEWQIMINKDIAGNQMIESLKADEVTVEGVSVMVLISENPVDLQSLDQGQTETVEQVADVKEMAEKALEPVVTEEDEEDDRTILFLGLSTLGVAAAAIIGNRMRKK